MSATVEQGHAMPHWFVGAGESDTLAWVALGFMALAVYGIFYLYGLFDRWAERKSEGTPLAKTIPTMLTIALLYEVFPLAHFNILLPLSALLLALVADWQGWRFSRMTSSTTLKPKREGDA